MVKVIKSSDAAADADWDDEVDDQGDEFDDYIPYEVVVKVLRAAEGPLHVYKSTEAVARALGIWSPDDPLPVKGHALGGGATR